MDKFYENCRSSYKLFHDFWHHLLNIYSTAQLQGNVRMHLKCVQDVSGMHARRVHASAKPRDKAATRRMWVPRPFLPDGGTSGTRVRRVWNVCKRNLGAELYCKGLSFSLKRLSHVFQKKNGCSSCKIKALDLTLKQCFLAHKMARMCASCCCNWFKFHHFSKNK